ncbi:hypothetical protein VBM87_00310 [Mycoplasma sp. 744]|uniref:hypothetical protein n=1 Tax=Mycoplasma sp. 744 TaxID=3108531 RepID=UPI002B1DE8F7|nr:hypothetical protein [Mycoplasma sp. 744]MEA4115231.1 hypothetical protein [Mycoplasma sp. 744]
MNWFLILKEKFGEIIYSCKIIRQDNMLLLDVILDTNDYLTVEQFTSEINIFLDLNYSSNLNFDYLSVSTKGKKTEYEIEELDQLLNEFIEVQLLTSVNKKMKFIGHLIFKDRENIVIKWNNKGQLRKQGIKINNISKIKKHIKF